MTTPATPWPTSTTTAVNSASPDLTSPDPATPGPDGAFALRGRLVGLHQVLADGVLLVQGPTIVWVGPADEVPAAWRDLVPAAGGRQVLLLPGLVDVHCHGGGGASFPDVLDVEQARVGAREHLAHGTTSLVASLVTAPPQVLVERTAVLAALADAGELVGIHLEGPFLSADRCGAQNPADMQRGSADLVAEVAAVARGYLTTMTVAPEVDGVADGVSGPGAAVPDDAVAALVAAGALPSVGHTDASAEQVEAAVARVHGLLAADGRARSPRLTATHLFNGMRPWHHRDPGPIASCLAAAARGELVVELVADGTHLADGTVRAVFDLVGADAIALVTDAMAAAGMPDGDYRLGPMAVRVADGVARILVEDAEGPAQAGAIAGGVAHLMDVVRAVVGAGVPLVEAVRAASATPARVLGRADLGALEAGRRADVVVTDAELRVLRVLRAGQTLVD